MSQIWFSSLNIHSIPAQPAEMQSGTSLPVTVIDEWHKHSSYIDSLATILAEDIIASKVDLTKTLILFTAHSLPASYIWEGSC
jgi:protoheme ferro-lyase